MLSNYQPANNYFNMYQCNTRYTRIFVYTYICRLFYPCACPYPESNKLSRLLQI